LTCALMPQPTPQYGHVVCMMVLSFIKESLVRRKAKEVTEAHPSHRLTLISDT